MQARKASWDLGLEQTYCHFSPILLVTEASLNSRGEEIDTSGHISPL